MSISLSQNQPHSFEVKKSTQKYCSRKFRAVGTRRAGNIFNVRYTRTIVIEIWAAVQIYQTEEYCIYLSVDYVVFWEE